jgi:hypothetical protein
LVFYYAYFLIFSPRIDCKTYPHLQIYVRIRYKTKRARFAQAKALLRGVAPFLVAKQAH